MSCRTFQFAIATAIVLLSGCASMPASKPEVASAESSCAPISEAQVVSLFERWNASLATGDPHQVSENYAPQSILLPTLSNQPRFTVEEKEDYFAHFLQNGPSGHIDRRFIRLGCNSAVDAGLYSFTFAKTGAVVHARYSYTYEFIDGQWLISSHHSSAMPEPASEIIFHADEAADHG